MAQNLAANITASSKSVPQDETMVLSVTGAPTPSLVIWRSDDLGEWEPLGTEPLIEDQLDGERVAISLKLGRTMRVRWGPGQIQPSTLVHFSGEVVTNAEFTSIANQVTEGVLTPEEAVAKAFDWFKRHRDDKGSQRTETPTATVNVTPTLTPPATVVQLKRSENDASDDQSLWAVIRLTTEALSFENYARFIDEVLCFPTAPSALGQHHAVARLAAQRSLPFPDSDPYRALKVATEVFMQLNCGVFFDPDEIRRQDNRKFRDEEELRLYRTIMLGDVERRLKSYLGGNGILPYLDIVRQNLPDWGLRSIPASDNDNLTFVCMDILREKLTRPCLVELIWSYWLEEGMLVQTTKSIAMRFQNRVGADGNDPLALIEIDPLRPLNNFLWGYIQDEEHRLTVPRRAYEYDHEYGMTLLGKAVPSVRGADSRSRFLEAFHNLLFLCAIFFKEEDDTTVVADAFPVLNALREVHLLLTQGAHNQYRDLPWTARQEMLMEEWILSRPEFREFLPRRIMVDYPEQWMHSVEAMKNLQAWRSADVLHFRDLSQSGERILLGIRYGEWTSEIHSEKAKNWARYFRPEIQRYTHAYRAVTGADLTDHVDATMPGVLLRQRLGSGRGARRVTAVPAVAPPRPVAAPIADRPAARPLPPPTGQPVHAELPAWSDGRG
jgi:hypothetical protein